MSLPARRARIRGLPRGRGALALAAVVAVGSTVACTDSAVEIGSELSLQLTAPSSIPLSDSLIVEYEAKGRSLLGLVVDYGDGAADTVPFVGSQSAGGRLAHKYSEAGQYQVTGRVQDGIEGSTMADVTVSVTP